MLGIYTYGVATTKDGGIITTDSDNSNNWDIFGDSCRWWSGMSQSRMGVGWEQDGSMGMFEIGVRYPQKWYLNTEHC